MRRPTALVIAAAIALAACRAAASPTPTPATATRASATPVPAATAPASAAATHTPAAARVIEATVTFDGTTCAYAGPTVVPVGSAIEWNEPQIWSPEDAAAGVPMRTLVEPYPELVLCINEAGDDLQVYPATLIQVMKG